MSRLLARIMLALLMLPVALLVYLVAAVVLHEEVTRNDELAMFVAGVVTALFMGGWWTALWLRSVRWTPPRIWLTLGSAVGSMVVGTALALGMATIEDDVAAIIGPPAAIFTWLTVTVFVWRETGGERATRVDVGGAGALVCPACGYNMTGLRQTTCPECGASYTIDELFSRQPGREAEALETRSSRAA